MRQVTIMVNGKTFTPTEKFWLKVSTLITVGQVMEIL